MTFSILYLCLTAFMGNVLYIVLEKFARSRSKSFKAYAEAYDAHHTRWRFVTLALIICAAIWDVFPPQG